MLHAHCLYVQLSIHVECGYTLNVMIVIIFTLYWIFVCTNIKPKHKRKKRKHTLFIYSLAKGK